MELHRLLSSRGILRCQNVCLNTRIEILPWSDMLLADDATRRKWLFFLECIQFLPMYISLMLILHMNHELIFPLERPRTIRLGADQSESRKVEVPYMSLKNLFVWCQRRAITQWALKASSIIRSAVDVLERGWNWHLIFLCRERVEIARGFGKDRIWRRLKLCNVI